MQVRAFATIFHGLRGRRRSLVGVRHDGTAAMELALLLSRSSEIRPTLRSTRKEGRRQQAKEEEVTVDHHLEEKGLGQTDRRKRVYTTYN